DQARTRAHFSKLFEELRSQLPDDSNEWTVVQNHGARLVRNPLKSFERQNLTFREGGIGSLPVKDLDAVRCMNVLMYYDAPTRSKMREWIADVLKPGGIFICGVNWFKSTNSRYTVFQKENETLSEKEFSFSIDNLRPFQLVTWFAMYDDDDETC